ncbi:MAG: hypothetical protein HONBIEJF_00565 [Fimbriimonadaceae bacterium]|nr:hypothetical protein [Fimbriimonadaceae bacterium]
MPFTFTIKVHRNNLTTRDAQIDFADGTNLNSNSDWIRSPESQSADVRIERPRWYENVQSRNVTFSGWADGREPFELTVFDRRGRERSSTTIHPNMNGRWVTRLNLPAGNFRVVASRGGWETGDEVRFSVQRANGSWGQNGERWNWNDWDDRRPIATGSTVGGSIAITAPRNGATVDGPSVTVSGRSNSSSVMLTVFRGAEQVTRTSVSVQNRRWSTKLSLPNGSYRMTVVSPDGSTQKEVGFRVR